MFLKLIERRHQPARRDSKKFRTSDDAPSVPKDTGVVDEDGDSAKVVDGSLDNSLAIGDRGGVHNGLSDTSWELSPEVNRLVPLENKQHTTVDLIDHLLGKRAIEVVDDHVRTTAGKEERVTGLGGPR
jgi:hypothetical protein